MAPDTMVVAVVAKESWKRKVVKVGPMASPLASTNQVPNAMKLMKRKRRTLYVCSIIAKDG